MKKQDILNFFDISGKVAMVIGAAGSCGSVAAKALAAAGAKVMGVTDRSVDRLKAVIKEIREDGGEAALSVGDITDHEAVKRMVKETVDTFGGIDILAVLSGIHREGPIVDQSLEDFQKVMDANVKGVWLICREVGKVMIAQGRGGKVILLSSDRGDLGMSGYSIYTPSKAAVSLLAKTLGVEWGPYKINVNAIAPTIFRSPGTQFLFENEMFIKEFTKRVPLGRLGEPEDFIGTMIFLSSKASDFYTGSIVRPDGGYTAG